MYWLEVSERATMVMENTTPATVIIELATAESRPRAPDAPEPKISGHRFDHMQSNVASTAIRPVASPTAPTTITAGANQKSGSLRTAGWSASTFCAISWASLIASS